MLTIKKMPSCYSRRRSLEPMKGEETLDLPSMNPKKAMVTTHHINKYIASTPKLLPFPTPLLPLLTSRKTTILGF
jgi:hypothetical protein